MTGVANEVLLGGNVATFIASLIGAVNLSTTGGQAAGATYGVNTLANAQASATAGAGATIIFTARAADASGNAVPTTETCAVASFGAATLTGGEVPKLDIKPLHKYDESPILPSPVFTAPADPTTGRLHRHAQYSDRRSHRVARSQQPNGRDADSGRTGRRAADGAGELAADDHATHGVASPYAAYPPAEARRLAERLEIHHTPKHGSWLNMAEIELRVLARPCLEERMDNQEHLAREVAAWPHARNHTACKIDWRFTTADARIKLKRLYPVILP